jgi:hypothetical protein
VVRRSDNRSELTEGCLAVDYCGSYTVLSPGERLTQVLTGTDMVPSASWPAGTPPPSSSCCTAHRLGPFRCPAAGRIGRHLPVADEPGRHGSPRLG